MSDPRPNVLLITLDQFRADCLSCAGHPIVQTPNLDALAAQGLRLANHYSQAAPCGPGRAALYTGMYQMNNRVVANGTPLDDRFDNIARAARRAGYEPALFGYTDQGVDPRLVTDADDPRLSTYEGVLPGFDEILNLDEHHIGWMQHLRDHGYDATDVGRMLASEHRRPVEMSVSTYLTDAFLDWLSAQPGGDTPWFAHASFIRPHPPYSAAGEYGIMYDAGDCPEPMPIPERRHRIHDALLANPQSAAPTDPAAIRRLKLQYFGMISEVDAQLGRIWTALRQRGEWDNTLVIVTSDHGEQLGDQGLVQKAGFFDSSYRIVGIIRHPQQAAPGVVVDRFTENIDIMPTICEAIGAAVPTQCDGFPLTPFVRGEVPARWRDAAFYEWDWRSEFIADGDHPWPWDRRLERCNLSVRRSTDRAYVQFGDGSWRCFDLASDPSWQTEISDADTVLAEAQEMLVWRSRHLDRTMTGMLLEHGGIGRRPT